MRGKTDAQREWEEGYKAGYKDGYAGVLREGGDKSWHSEWMRGYMSGLANGKDKRMLKINVGRV